MNKDYRLEIGEKLILNNNTYEVVNTIPTGVSGNCYKVRQSKEGVYYIIKEYMPRHNGFSEGLIRNKENGQLIWKIGTEESKKKRYYNYVNKQIEHEINVYKSCNEVNDNNNPYIFEARDISEYMSGKYLRIDTEYGYSLSEYKYTTLEESIKIIMLVIEAIYVTCYEHNYYHLDIKPDNLYYSANRINVLDFGTCMEFNKKFNSFNEILESSVCLGTVNFRSGLLSQLHNSIDSGNERKSLQLINSISIKEDIYSIVATFLYLVLGKSLSALWDEIGGRVTSNRELIRKALTGKKIDSVYVSCILKICERACVIEPYNQEDSENYQFLIKDGGLSLYKDFNNLLQIVKNNGYYDEIVQKKSKEYICKKEIAENIVIIPEILPHIKMNNEKEEYIDIISVLKKMLNSEDESINKYAYVYINQAGAGKTYSMLYLWQELLKNECVIPIYISVSNLLDKNHNIYWYIVENYLEKVDINIERDLFVNRIKSMIENSNKKYVLMVDGINWAYNQRCLEMLKKDIQEFQKLQNVYIIASGRYVDFDFVNFSNLQFKLLSEKQVREYVKKYHSGIISNGKVDKVLQKPMILTMVYAPHKKQDRILADVRYNVLGNLTEGEIIQDYFDILKRKDFAFEIVIEYLLPLFTVFNNYNMCIDDLSVIKILDRIRKYIKANRIIQLKISRISAELVERLLKEDKEQLLEQLFWNTIIDNKLLIEENGRYRYANSVYQDFFWSKAMLLMSSIDSEYFNLLTKASNTKLDILLFDYNDRVMELNKNKYLIMYKKQIININSLYILMMIRMTNTCLQMSFSQGDDYYSFYEYTIELVEKYYDSKFVKHCSGDVSFLIEYFNAVTELIEVSLSIYSYYFVSSDRAYSLDLSIKSRLDKIVCGAKSTLRSVYTTQGNNKLELDKAISLLLCHIGQYYTWCSDELLLDSTECYEKSFEIALDIKKYLEKNKREGINAIRRILASDQAGIRECLYKYAIREREDLSSKELITIYTTCNELNKEIFLYCKENDFNELRWRYAFFAEYVFIDYTVYDFLKTNNQLFLQGNISIEMITDNINYTLALYDVICRQNKNRKFAFVDSVIMEFEKFSPYIDMLKLSENDKVELKQLYVRTSNLICSLCEKKVE